MLFTVLYQLRRKRDLTVVVVVAGGFMRERSGGGDRTAEVYLPRTERWQAVDDLTEPRYGCTGTGEEAHDVSNI